MVIASIKIYIRSCIILFKSVLYFSWCCVFPFQDPSDDWGLSDDIAELDKDIEKQEKVIKEQERSNNEKDKSST